MSAELGAVVVAALVPLLIAQVRVVENEGESSNKRHAPGRGAKKTRVNAQKKRRKTLFLR